jgi:vancomycin resistance protein YoaR
MQPFSLNTSPGRKFFWLAIPVIYFILFSLPAIAQENIPNPSPDSVLPAPPSSGENLGLFPNPHLQKLLLTPYDLTFKKQKLTFHARDFTTTKVILSRNPHQTSEIENIDFCLEDSKAGLSCELTSPLFRKAHVQKAAFLFIDKTKITHFLTETRSLFREEPINSRLEIDDQGNLTIIKKGAAGYRLDIDQSIQAITQAIKKIGQEEAYQIPLVVKYIDPVASEGNLDNLGIKEKIAQGESNFAGSPKNRVHNIEVATSKFHGLVIPPGGEFSFVENLGPVDGSTGYKEELVIKKNETIKEFGGGVCQVSTTVFRAALNAGFKITERRNHAYPVQYYSPQGTDATIYIPSPDLKFINNTPHHVLIQAHREGYELYFEFYGTSDGRQVELLGPRVTKRTEDGRMNTVLYQVIKDPQGKEIRKDEFKSYYDNPAKYH